MSEEIKSDVESRITQYLSLGGLLNPELMEHDKVRDLIIDCRDQLAQQKAMLDESLEVIKELIPFSKNGVTVTDDLISLWAKHKAFLVKTKENKK